MTTMVTLKLTLTLTAPTSQACHAALNPNPNPNCAYLPAVLCISQVNAHTGHAQLPPRTIRAFHPGPSRARCRATHEALRKQCVCLMKAPSSSYMRQPASLVSSASPLCMVSTAPPTWNRAQGSSWARSCAATSGKGADDARHLALAMQGLCVLEAPRQWRGPR